MSENLPPPEDIDTGTPVAEIAALAEDPDVGFLGRIRRNILTRINASHFLDFAVPMVLDFFKEIGDLLFGGFEGRAPAPGANDDE